MSNNSLYQNKKSILQRRSAYAFIAVICLICISALFINTGLQLQRNMLLVTKVATQQQLLLRETGEKISLLINSIPRPEMSEKTINVVKDEIRNQKLEINKNQAQLLNIYSPDNHTFEHFLLIMLAGDQTPKLEDLNMYIKNLNQRISIILMSDATALITGHLHWRPPDLILLDDGKITQAMEQLIADIYLGSSKQTKILAVMYSTLLVITITGIFIIWHITFRPLADQLKILDEKIRDSHNKLYRRLHTDTLTGLKNRNGFELEMSKQFKECKAINMGLLLIDIDGFKSINDAYGHGVGDEVLTLAANRLKFLECQQTKAFRLGGDEFIILCLDVPDRQTLDQLGKKVCGYFYRPFNITRQEISLSASIGISWQAHSMKNISGKELLRAADIALAKVKQRGKNNYLFFDQASSINIEELITTETQLYDAIEKNEIKPHYQPIVDLKTKKIIHLEALARWDHPTRDILPPSEWMGVADQALLSRITEQMIEQIRSDIAYFNSQGFSDFCININTTESMLVQGTTLNIVREIINQFGHPARIGIEITESVIFDRSYAVIKEQLQLISKEGVKLFLDDFGTGYASLSHLKGFPVDTIKIDKSFIRGLPLDSDKVIVQAMLTLAKGLNKSLICEGIETEEVSSLLQEMGCRYGQGYLFSKALSTEDLLPVLRQGAALNPEQTEVI